MIALVWAANVLGWPVIQLAVSSAAVRVPSHVFERDNWMTVPRRWEQDGALYRNYFAVRKWKSLLPDGGPWLGGVAKRKLIQRNPTALEHFLVETRRAEIAHWCMLGCLPIFFIWNPPWACWVMTGYALASNLPCILVQRYNRFALRRIVGVRRHALVQS